MNSCSCSKATGRMEQSWDEKQQRSISLTVTVIGDDNQVVREFFFCFRLQVEGLPSFFWSQLWVTDDFSEYILLRMEKQPAGSSPVF